VLESSRAVTAAPFIDIDRLTFAHFCTGVKPHLDGPARTPRPMAAAVFPHATPDP